MKIFYPQVLSIYYDSSQTFPLLPDTMDHKAKYVTIGSVTRLKTRVAMAVPIA